MYISEKFKEKKTVISFEVFPPKKETDVNKLLESLSELKSLKPDFVSVTYGAAGNDSTEKTLEIANIVKNQYNIEVLMHLTCVFATKEKINGITEKVKKCGIDNVLALRGDLPKNETDTDPLGDYNYAKDLIRDLNNKNLCIGAASYPEGHIDCDDFSLSITHLKQKVDAGAKFLISQLFFDNSYFYKYREAATAAGINVPQVAGVMPILGVNQIKRMIFMCGASLPAKITKILNKYENDADSLKKAGIEYAYRQVEDLVREGVDGVHIYTMNMPNIARSIVEKL